MKNLFCYCISVGPVTYENPPISEKTIQAISINNEMPKHILEVDTKRYIRMEILLKQLMDMLIARNQNKDQQNNKKHQKEEK